MSDLLATAERLFAAQASAAELHAAGLHLLLVPQADGGFGASHAEAYAVLRLAGEHGADAAALGAPEPFATVAQMVGAMTAALAMTVEHVNTRVQFGAPLAKRQAVQQALAVFACEVAAADAAGQALARALDRGAADFETAAAKLRANRAAAVAVATAHQLHGAIGFTAEHPLGRLTARLIDWRGAHGNDRICEERLGALVAARGPAHFWADLTDRTDQSTRT